MVKPLPLRLEHAQAPISAAQRRRNRVCEISDDTQAGGKLRCLLLAQGRSHGPPPAGPLSGVNPPQRRLAGTAALDPKETSVLWLAGTPLTRHALTKPTIRRRISLHKRSKTK